jgi:hypothetical protein
LVWSLTQFNFVLKLQESNLVNKFWSIYIITWDQICKKILLTSHCLFYLSISFCPPRHYFNLSAMPSWLPPHPVYCHHNKFLSTKFPYCFTIYDSYAYKFLSALINKYICVCVCVCQCVWNGFNEHTCGHMLLSRFSGVALFDPFPVLKHDICVYVCKSQERIDPCILAIIDFVL